MKHSYKIRPKYLYCTTLTLLILFTVTWKTAANDANDKMFDSPLTTDQEPVTQKPIVRDTLPKIKIVATDTTRRLNTDSSQVIQTTDTFTLKLSNAPS